MRDFDARAVFLRTCTRDARMHAQSLLHATYNDTVTEASDAGNIFAALPDLNGRIERQL